MRTDPRLITIAGWVGRSHAELNCWELVRAAYRLRHVQLPATYHDALLKGMFRTVFEPEPFDLLAIANHRLWITNHVALYLGDGKIIHSLEDFGVVQHEMTRSPWWDRVVRERSGEGRKGFLRLRQDYST